MNKEEKVSKKLAKYNVSLKQSIYYYLLITKPIHKLSNKRIEIVTEMLYIYTKEKRNFARESDVWKVVFSKDSLADIREELDMAKNLFYNYLYDLRKSKVIINNEINPVYNPLIKDGSEALEITFRFNIKDEGKE